MENHRHFASDDENDSLLFSRMQEHVLENFPNPQRIGCLDHETLRKIVMTPEALDLTDVRYLHVFKCAECTQELIDLRGAREAGLTRSDAESECPSPLNEPFAVHRQRSSLTVFFDALAAFAAIVRHRFLSLKARLTRE